MSDRTEPSGKPGVIAELRRRNVFRAAALYIAAVWALSQGIAQLAPVFHAPDWIARWFVIACVIGFPFWLVFAWLFQITPTGLKRDDEVHQSESIAHRTSRKLDFWIIGALGVAVVLLITNQFVLHRDATSVANVAQAKAIAAAFAKIPEKSVAVLPLANESGDPKQQYFSDGLSEELIADLTQIDGLKVIGKYSSFKFRNSTATPAEIGAALGVAHLIQGAVRQQGDRIRVNVSMIRAQDGSSVWAHTYDDQLKDVFAIQSRIGEAVAAALKIELLSNGIVSTDKPPSENVKAYQLMLQGHALAQRNTKAGYAKAIALLREAVQLDPEYAYAWGVLSTALINQGRNVLTGAARQEAFAQARVAARRQQALAPDAAATHRNRGYLLANVNHDAVGALAEFRRALELAPNDADAMAFLAWGLTTAGQLEPAAELFRKALKKDPLRTQWYANLASILVADGQLDAAEKASGKALTLQPGFPGMHTILAQIDILRGDGDAARREAAKETTPVLGPWIRALAEQVGTNRRRGDDALRAFTAEYGKSYPYFVADIYAVRKQPDKMFEWLERAWVQQDPAFPSMLYDPFPLAYKNDPRFAALCQRSGLPVPGKPLVGVASSNRH